EQPPADLNENDETDRAVADSDNSTANNADDDGPTTSLDNADYLDFLITGYDPDENPPDPHDRFPRNHQRPAPAREDTGPAERFEPLQPPAQPAGAARPDDPPPF
ncbi:MAG TPA: hypothetical protein VES60_05245, partial [Nakamurella sp.]|nr:hypothetical protein [Nakamurella sp.]